MVYRFVLFIFVLCAILIGVVRGVLPHQPPPEIAALLPDVSCTAPCWQGLRPGYSTPDDVQQRLTDSRWPDAVVDGGTAGSVEEWTAVLGDDARLWFGYSSQSPAQNELQLRPAHLRVGDVIAALGEPDAVAFAYVYPHRSVRSRVELEFRLYYRASGLMASGTLPPYAVELDAAQRVEVLNYPALALTLPLLAFEWRGFGSLVKHYYPDGVTP